jgi:hypothetical protein
VTFTAILVFMTLFISFGRIELTCHHICTNVYYMDLDPSALWPCSISNSTS